jgi:tetratricopeptide (TPR) repeat protein
VKEGNDRVHILAVRSTVLGKLGRLPEAIEALREAEPLVIGTRQWIVSLNLASAVYSAGLADEALNILSRIDIASSARSDLDRFKYHYLRASALEDVGDFKQAQEVAAKAIAVIEELRGKLRDLSLRSSWTTQQQAVYALAIRVTAQNGNASAAFDLLEKSRSRQLVDELAIGHAPLDEEGRRLEQRIKEVKQERDLLMSLDDSNAAGSTDPQRLASLRTLNPKLDILELDADGNQTISSEKLQRARLRATRVIEGMQSDIAQRRLNSAERLFGNVVGSHQVREMLARLT